MAPLYDKIQDFNVLCEIVVNSATHLRRDIFKTFYVGN